MTFQPNTAYLADMILPMTAAPQANCSGTHSAGPCRAPSSGHSAVLQRCQGAAPDFPELLSDTGISATLLVTSTNMSTTFTTGMSLQPSWLSSSSWRSVYRDLNILV